MQITTPGTAFGEWLEDNVGEDEPTKLAALHECIIRMADRWIQSGEITAEWANKKLWSLGVQHHFPAANGYKLSTTVVAFVELNIVAADREAALTIFKQRVTSSLTVNNADAPYPIRFTSGPEDFDPNVTNPDAPRTLADTLVKLRETIMLGNISGPRWDCDSGTNRVLAAFGLDPLPERKKFKVARPVTAQAYTTVEAYDEAGAQRVAEWRWEDGRKSHTVENPVSEDGVDLSVTEVSLH